MWTDGLRFECTLCHACCRHDPGYVFLSEADIQRLSQHLSLSPEQFLSEFCRCVDLDSGPVYSLKEKQNFDCIFWDLGCTVYPARPLQCQTYPFWGRIVASKHSWNQEARFCPGIDRGSFHSAEIIEQKVKSLTENQPKRCH